MKVIVAGGTGFIGSHLCAELAERGHDVTALARTPEDADLPNTVETAMGDVTAYESIESHFEGQDVAVNLVSLSPLFKPKGKATHEGVHLRGTENVIRACEEHDVGKLVQMSGLGVDPDGPTEFLRAKAKAEERVKESDLDWVIVRPSVVFGEGDEFMSFTKLVTTPYVTGLPAGGDTRFQPIWVGDLAPMLADAVEDDEHDGQTYELGGPDVLSLSDVTRLAYTAEGKSVRILPVPMPLAKVGMTLAGPIPFIPFGPDQARSLKINNVTEHNDVAAFGVEPEEMTTLASYLGVEPPDEVAA